MYFLLDACKNPTILRVLYFGYLFWEIVAVLVPIGLIIMLMIDFTKAVVISKEDEQVKSMKLVVKRIMYAVFIFATPWIVSLLMSILGGAGVDIGTDYTICINTVKNISAGTDNIERYDNLLELEEESNDDKNKLDDEDYVSDFENHYDIAVSMVELAKREKGHKGGSKYSGTADSVPWCAYFVSWVLKHTKYDDNMSLYKYMNEEGLIKSDGGANGLMFVFKNGKRSNFQFHKSKAFGGDYTPKKGDIIWYWYENGFGYPWNGSTLGASHVGIVDYVEGDYVVTVEGNLSIHGSTGSATNVVGTPKRSLNSKDIIAYGSWYSYDTMK